MWFGLSIKGSIVSFQTLIALLSPYCSDIIHRDIRYLVPDNPAYIIKMSPSVNYTYSGESRDCDDAVRILRGWLSRKNYGNVLAMDVKIWNQETGYHAVIGFWYKGRLVLADPGTGQFDVYKNSVIKRIIL